MDSYFQTEQLKHLVLTQYYRWYQVYEVPFTAQRINNQKDILDDQVVISSQNGSTKGKDGLEERLLVFEGWRNAHHVQHASISRLAGDRVSLEADIRYQNIRPDGSAFSYTLHYSTELRTRANDLPLFTQVDLRPTGSIDVFTFEEAYPKNRVKSFVHYFLYLLAAPDEERFKELLCSDAEVSLNEEAADACRLDFAAWLSMQKAPRQDAVYSFSQLEIESLSDGSFIVSLDIKWEGVDEDGRGLYSLDWHKWHLTNDKNERFLRIKRMEQRELVPMSEVL